MGRERRNTEHCGVRRPRDGKTQRFTSWDVKEPRNTETPGHQPLNISSKHLLVVEGVRPDI